MNESEIASLREVLRDADLGADLENEIGERTPPHLKVDASQAVALLRRLRDDPGTAMQRLVDLMAIDRGGASRFEVIYRLHVPTSNARLDVRVAVAEADPVLDSVVSLWSGANWLEREVFDLYGIHFRGHPDLRRILLPADFEGAPLRKDYPRQPNLALPKEAES